MKFKLSQIPYDDNQVIFQKKEIEIHPGLTVLVGCNGSGKTTLLKEIKTRLQEKNIAYHDYSNYTDGGTTSLSSMLFYGDFEVGCSLLTSSEGEQIIINLGTQSTKYKNFLKSGVYKDKSYELEKAFNPNISKPKTKKRFLLFDAIDSGLSINLVLEVKELFNIIFKDAESLGVELYIIISANEYELCNGEQCFDVTSGEYITFKDYEDYKQFIINSDIIKQQRLQHKVNKPKPKRRRINPIFTRINEEEKNND